MNRKISKIFIIFIVLFLFSTKVAYASTKCSDIDEEIKNYDSIKTELSNLDCTKNTDSSIVNKCNDLYLKKSITLTNLHRYKEGKFDCPSQIDKIGVILDENKDNCSSVTDGMIESATKKAMTIFYILAPILVIVFGSLDYTKAVVSSNPDLLKKATTDFVKRLTAMVLLFLSPAIVNIIIGMNISNNILSGEGYTCKTNHIDLQKSFTIDYVPKQNESYVDNTPDETEDSGVDTSNNASSNLKGNYLKWLQYDRKWGSKIIGNGRTMSQVGCFVTSIAIQIANSHTAKSSNFDPGKLVDSMKKNGGFSGAALVWKDSWTDVAPKFASVNFNEQLSGNLNQKTKILKKQIEKGYYPVVQVKDGSSGSSHYVAVIAIKNGKIVMADPASNKTNLDCSSYPRFCSGTKQMALFKVK